MQASGFKPLKKIITLLLILLLGLGAGAGAAFGVSQLLGPPPTPDPHAAKKIETAFVPTGPLVLPIVTTDANLSGYGAFEMQIEVALDDEADVGANMPMVLHAINMRAWATPMAAGRQKILPDLDVLTRLALDAAQKALGKGKVLRVVVTSARPV